MYLKKSTLALATRSDLSDATMVKVAANIRVFSRTQTLPRRTIWNNWVVK